MVPRTTHHTVALAAAALLASGAVAAPAPPAHAVADAAAVGADVRTGAGPRGRDCRLVRLEEPRRGSGGGVMDIERVGRRTVYYGSSHKVDRAGTEHQRAYVWFGRNGEPRRVGPRGWHHDIALELTATGLVNGVSENADRTESAAWVQDLRTGELSYFDTDSGPRGTEHGYSFIRRIDDRGAAAGSVHRTADPEEWRTDAVGFAGVDAPMTMLAGTEGSRDAGAYGINNHGQRAGYVSTESWPENEEWNIWQPVRWEADGTVTELVTPHGIEAAPRAVKDDGSVSGFLFWGETYATGHVEAAYWPTPDVGIGLGVLPGGGWSDAFGMDEGGWLVGAMDRAVDPEKNPMGPEGFVNHGFLWNPSTTPGTVRILPSLYGQRKGLRNWRRWVSGAVHAVNADLDQAGTGTHVGYRDGQVVMAPTVFLRASRCGREVATTHDPFGAGSADGARAAAASRRSALDAASAGR